MAFRWAEPDEEVHRFVNDLEGPIGTYLYGRRMHETMAGQASCRALVALVAATEHHGALPRPL